MREFFQGWRRKAGLLTLLVACLFMTGWVRSLVVQDRIEFTKFTGLAKKDNWLAGVATEGQSLVLLVYKIDERVCKFGETFVSYSSAELRSVEVVNYSNNKPAAPVTEAQPAPNLVLNTTVNGPPTTQTYVMADQSTASPTTTTFQYTAPLPASMRDSPAEISIKPMSNQDRTSVLRAVYILPLVVIPFWAIVVPLTLISLWLLPVRPKSLNQKKSNDEG